MKRKERIRFRGIAATTDPIEKSGRSYQLTEEILKKAAEDFVGKPMQYGHRGRPIGKIEKAWYEDGKLHVEGVIYEPQNEAEKKILEKIEKGEIRGLSPSFNFKPLLKKVVLHGSLEVIGEKEDGTLKIRAKIPMEEIVRKLGSTENIKKYAFTQSWIHDGTPESKKRIEHEVLDED